MTAPITLAAFAVVVATLGRWLLARSAWPDRSPRLGILAWQALSLSILVSVVLAGLALAVPEIPFSTNVAALVSACTVALRSQYATPGGAVLSVTGGMLAVTVVARVGFCLLAGLVTSRRQRRRQLEALTLVPRGHEGCGARVVDHPAAAAYCLPGRREQIVVTTAAVAALDPDQLTAVLAHERAHLRGRHDLMLAASDTLRRAFPRVQAFSDAHHATVRLVEMLADDVAARRNDRLTIATALVRLAEAPAPAPAASLGAGGSTALARVRRLVAPAHPLSVTGSAIAVLVAAALLATPVAVVAAPAVVATAADLCPISFSGQMPS
ncbi:MAG: M56 family metallopeptidase [Nocardioidaceae bacterium]|nr:M56 family metallopeptidase [Nocardioidaceae bacterium]